MAASRVPVKLCRKSTSAGLASSDLTTWRGGTRRKVSGACLLPVEMYSLGVVDACTQSE